MAKDGVKKRIADRKAFVGATKGAGTAVAARKKFFVQTRMAELKAKGKTGDAKALRAKFDSGGVTRAGFYNKVDKARNKAGRGGSKAIEINTKIVPKPKDRAKGRGARP